MSIDPGSSRMNPAFQARVRQLQAEADHRRAIREFAERRQADEQAKIGALLAELVDALAGLFDEPACAVCITCTRALPPRSRNCPHCGAADEHKETGQTTRTAAA